jgi:hypothetical protein
MNNQNSLGNNRMIKPDFEKDRRRTRHHWAVTITYADGKKFRRVYTDETKARGFATREKRSPVVWATSVRFIS